MVNIAIKVLAVIAGIVAAAASYDPLNNYVFALIAFIGCIAVGVIVGALAYYFLKWLLAEVSKV